ARDAEAAGEEGVGHVNSAGRGVVGGGGRLTEGRGSVSGFGVALGAQPNRRDIGYNSGTMSTKLVCPDCGGVLGVAEPGEMPCKCFSKRAGSRPPAPAAVA